MPALLESVPDLPVVSPWQPEANEVAPQIKVAAVRVLEALGTVPDGVPVSPAWLTADVRLRRTGRSWAVSELHPVLPQADAVAALRGPAAELAASPRVLLPNAAAADLAAGVVDERVVASLLVLLRTYELAITVFRAGHPAAPTAPATTSAGAPSTSGRSTAGRW